MNGDANHLSELMQECLVYPTKTFLWLLSRKATLGAMLCMEDIAVKWPLCLYFRWGHHFFKKRFIRTVSSQFVVFPYMHENSSRLTFTIKRRLGGEIQKPVCGNVLSSENVVGFFITTVSQNPLFSTSSCRRMTSLLWGEEKLPWDWLVAGQVYCSGQGAGSAPLRLEV